MAAKGNEVATTEAVSCHELGKCYAIYDRPQDRLWQALGLGRRRRYREFWALRGVSFEVRPGETVGVVGRNGSGKSTLLQMICGTLQPTTGTVAVRGRVAALLELGAGFNPEFTGRENVHLNAAVLGLSAAEIRDRYESIVEFAELRAFMDRPVKTYSSGMFMRLAFSVAASVEPDLLIVDEALAVGDEAFQRKCHARLERIRERGGTVLFVSHSAAAVVQYCDRAVLLDQGELLAVGSPKPIVNQYHRLLYAPAERAEAIRAQIREEFGGAGAGRAAREATAHEVAGVASKPAQAPAIAGDPTDEDEAFFDPFLKAKSTVAYESRGVRLGEAVICDALGRPVNVIGRGRRYRLRYEATFDEAVLGPRCGFMIRTTTGWELGGFVSAASESESELVPAGACRTYEFEFSCKLAPGVYFLNIGVVGRTATTGDETFLDRRVDALMFRVMPETNLQMTGMVDFDVRCEVRGSEGRATAA